MKRREFLTAAFAATSAPALAAFPKPEHPVKMGETWMYEPFGAYLPYEFVYLKPHVELMDGGLLSVIWMSREIASGWTEWSQDGGRSWRRSWTSRDGFRSCLETVHRSVLEGADLTKPLKFRTVTRPVSSYGSHFEYLGEPQSPLSGANSYDQRRRRLDQSRVDFKGVEYIDEGEIGPVVEPDGTQNTIMFNDLHHGYGSLCSKLMPKVSDRPVNLAVFAGDIIDHARSKFDFDQYLSGSLAYVGRQLKCACRYVRGNHELMGAYGSHLRDVVAPAGDHPFYAAATLGGLRAVFLDSGADGPDGDWTNMDLFDFNRFFKEETAWLDRETSGEEWKKAKKRVAFIHIPPVYGRDKTRFCGDARRVGMYRILRDRGLDLMMAGHTHNPLFAKPYEGLTSYPTAIGGSPNPRNATVTRCVYSNGSLTVDQFMTDGTVNFKETIN